MVFPQTQLPVKVELNLGGWTDVTTYVREASGISISRGRQDESSQTERTQATFTIDNSDGRFSERNPTGPYYGLLSLNTPCRISLTRDTKVLELPGGDADRVSAPDAAALDITGDIDIRVDAHLYEWRTATVLACKWRSISPTNQRSWAFEVTSDGYLKLWWTTGGTLATRLSVTSTTVLPVTAGRQAVRVTLDVNNGASGNTVTFYTSDTISGTWTQLGSAVVTSGTTSIHSGSAVLEAGGYGESSDSASELAGGTAYGWLYAFQLRSGIGGTLVANPDFTAQTVGVSSFADTASPTNTWTLTSGASLTDRNWRFHGEVSAWPQVWDQAMRNVTVAVTASGPLRRLTQGTPPARSAIDRSVIVDSTVLAYWPCEDAGEATVIASGLPAGRPMRFSGTPNFASYAGFPGSQSSLVINDAKMVGGISGFPSSNELQLQFLLHLPDAGLAIDFFDAVQLVTTNYRFNLEYDSPGSGGRLYVTGDPFIGSAPTTPAISNVNGTDMCVTITAVQNGGNVDYSLAVYTLATGTAVTVSASHTGTLGPVQNVTFGSLRSTVGIGEVAIGHVIVRNSQAPAAEVASHLNGRAGEAAGTRFARLCTEAGLGYRSIGDLASTELMGVQRPATLVDLLRECATTDLGMLFEPLDMFGLGYRTRRTLENQSNALTASYTAQELAAPPTPTPDDENVRNEYTVQRAGGSKSKQALTVGRMSTADPSEGIGRYAVEETLSLYSDTQTADQAAFRLLLGTVDDERYPNIDLRRETPGVVANAALNAALLALNVGHILAIDGMPTPFVAPGQVRQMVQGWSERLAAFEHAFTFNTTPALPWDLGVIEDTDVGRFDTAGSELVTAVNSSATSLVVATTVGEYWTESAAEFPFDVSLAGEVVTVTDIDPAISDTFTRSTSNGWGTAASGQAWTRTGGNAADFSVNGSAGAISVTAVNSERWVTLSQTSDAWDVGFRARTLALAVTQPINVYIGAMLTGTSNGYIARMAFYNDQTIRLSIEEMPFALLAAEVTVPGLTHAANSWFRLRFKVSGGQLMARAWADGSTEPQFWHVYATDTTYTSGGCGVRTILTTGNTTTLPAAVQFDDVTSYTPQTFTVTRAVNGLSKSQAAATDVRLTHPMIFSM